MARTTVDNTVQRIRRQLGSAVRYEVDTLTTTVDSTTDQIILDHALPPSVQPGGVLVIEAETMRIMSVDRATRTCTVFRGWLDTEGAEHSAGVEIQINPRFTTAEILDAIEAEIEGWGPDLFQVISREHTVAASDQTLELNVDMVDMYGVIDVRRKWDSNDSTAWPRINYRYQRGVAADWTGAPTSGQLLRFLEGVDAGTIYVVAAIPFTTDTFDMTTDLVTDVGLSKSLLDVLEMGVRIRLMSDAEHQRSARIPADEPRRAEEVPPRSARDDALTLHRLYTMRKNEEINRLRRLYPVMQG